MKAGRLRHFVTLQQRSEVRDAVGGTAPSWSSFADVWAEVKPVSAREILAGKVLAEVSHQVTIRFLVGVKPSFRLIHDGRVLEVQTVINVDERDQLLQLLCREVV